jgi:hypothetical protein
MLWWSIIAGAALAFATSGIISSISSGVASNAVWGILATLVRGRSRHTVGIAGFWLGRVHIREDQRRVSYTMWRITGNVGKVTLYTEVYDKNVPVLTCHGSGSFNPPLLAAYYAFSSRKMNRTGVATFRLGAIRRTEPVLSGSFMQIVDPDFDARRRFPGVSQSG